MTYTTQNEKILQEAKHNFAEAVVIFLRFGASRKQIREMLQECIHIYDEHRRGKSSLILPEDL